MFEGPVTGNIPEFLDNGEVTDGTHVTAGQLALALTPYAQVTDLQAFRSQLLQNAAKYVRLNALPRPGQPQPPPQIIGRLDDVERLLDKAGHRAQRRRGDGGRGCGGG